MAWVDEDLQLEDLQSLRESGQLFSRRPSVDFHSHTETVLSMSRWMFVESIVIRLFLRFPLHLWRRLTEFGRVRYATVA